MPNYFDHYHINVSNVKFDTTRKVTLSFKDPGTLRPYSHKSYNITNNQYKLYLAKKNEINCCKNEKNIFENKLNTIRIKSKTDYEKVLLQIGVLNLTIKRLELNLYHTSQSNRILRNHLEKD